MGQFPTADDTPAQAEVGTLVERASTLVEQYQIADHAIAHWLRLEFEMKAIKPVLASSSLLDTDEFMSAVRDALPKKHKMSAAQIAELRREHATTIEPARRTRMEVFALERRLSTLVNDAYGLTPEEVDLMWRTAPPRMPFTPAGLEASESDLATEPST